MALIVFFLIIGFPVAEVLLMMRVSQEIGGWNTFFLFIFSAVFGVYIAKIQGQLVLQRIQKCLMEGHIPTAEMLDGMLVFLAGVLFALPGFISDGVGLILLFPPTRWLVGLFLKSRVRVGQEKRARQGASARPDFGTKKSGASGFGRGAVEDAQIIE